MNISVDFEYEKKQTKRTARIATTIYLLLFPILSMYAIASLMIFDSPSMTIPFGLSIIFLFFCIPLSIPFTLYFVWSRFSQGEYKKSRQFCLLTFYIALGTLFYNALVDILIHSL